VTAPHHFSSALKAAAVAVVTTAVVGSGAPALAAGTHLCDGYKGCADAGMTSAGYAAVNDKSYWRMYSGHNCTNYAAYRMILSGMANVRPWSGGGNATYWGVNLPEITDDTPRVGAIAWWNDGGPGHVAYVEKVISSSEIIISQDSWGGDFSWARVVKSERWPAGFIHFNDREMTNRGAPTFSGTARVGSDVTASPGSWSPAPSQVSYQWFVVGTALPRETSRTVRLHSVILGKSLGVKVTATKTGYPRQTVSARATSQILPGSITSPVDPKVTGTAQVTRELRLSPGSWRPQPVKVSYQWLVDGEPVKGATSTRFQLLPKYAGHAVSANVQASRSGYASVIRNVSAGKVAFAKMQLAKRSVLEGTGVRGNTLRVSLGRTDRQAVHKVQWYRDGEPIAGATKASYVLTSKDVRRYVTARVTHAKYGYAPVVEQLGRRLVKGTVKLNTSREKLRHGWRFSFRPTVAGQPVTEPTRMVVRWRGDIIKRGVIRDGKINFAITGLPKGRQRLVFFVEHTSVSLQKVTWRKPYFR
jgi:surface antigen